MRRFLWLAGLATAYGACAQLIAAEYGPLPAPPADAKDGSKKGRCGQDPVLPDSFSIVLAGR
jgi:hypothetical protein